MRSKTDGARFQLGQIVVTPKAREVLRASGQSPEELLARHQAGDWGDVSEQERSFNDEGLLKQLNLISVYSTPSGGKIRVFTKADRSHTLLHITPH